MELTEKIQDDYLQGGGGKCEGETVSEVGDILTEVRGRGRFLVPLLTSSLVSPSQVSRNYR